MKVAFRADASLLVGTGHIMRCLTLADALRNKGAQCHFVCREHPGNLIDMIRQRGFAVSVLRAGAEDFQQQVDVLQPPSSYSAWLGCDWSEDAEQMKALLRGLQFDWLVVDHYALDARWETELKPHYRKLMVIDDLADRPHLCDLLLDQTLARNPDAYRPHVPADCTLLTGSQYALLRPEFSALREYSLRRRGASRVKHLLITLGGVDRDNATGRVLEALRHSVLPGDCCITVVMGATAPWLDSVRQQADTLRWATEVRVNVTDMAQLMADSDLAIGAAGATSWERCCLGLPAIMIVLAANQEGVARALEKVGAVCLLAGPGEIEIRLKAMLDSLLQLPARLADMSCAASGCADGRGVRVVIDQME